MAGRSVETLLALLDEDAATVARKVSLDATLVMRQSA
jgi:DNA-binding LacI/PurR family transcriptional regulator